jgi:hypothetical protein
MTSPLARLRDWLLTGRLPGTDSVPEALALVATAREQGLAGLLHGALAARSAEWPAEALAALRDLHMRLAARAVRQEALLDRSLALLARTGLHALPLKGAALAGLVYQAGERPMADIDLLAVESFEASLAALTRAGFSELDRADHAVALADPETDMVLELHSSPTSCPGFYRVNPPALWNRAVALGEDPGRRRPSNEDLLLQLCLHMAFQHGLCLRLVHFLDVRRLLGRQGMDTGVVAARAAEAGAEAAIWAALSASEALVGAPVPAGLLGQLRTRTSAGLVRAVAARLRQPEALLAPGDVAGRELWRMRWMLASGRRLELLARTLTPPSAPGRGPTIRVGRILGRGLALARRWGPIGPRAPRR